MADAGADAASRRTSRRRRLLLLALFAAAVAVVAVVYLLRDGVRQGGPLSCGGCDAIADSLPLDVGHSGTTGEAFLENRGEKDAVLDELTFEQRASGMQILGPMAIRIGDYHGPGGGAAGLAVGFPPKSARGAARPIRGFVVHPHRSYDETVELLIGFRPLRPGVHSYRSFNIHYHVGNTRYVAHYPYSTTVCAPEAKYVGACPITHP